MACKCGRGGIVANLNPEEADKVFEPISLRIERWSEWIAQGVYDQPSIETRAEFKEAVAMAIKDSIKDLGIDLGSVK